MKTKIFWVVMGLGSVIGASLAVASDCIIDPEKVMVHAASEPIFLSDDKPREVASQDVDGKPHYARGHDQYLDVLKEIPFSEPAVKRSWLEYKIMKED